MNTKLLSKYTYAGVQRNSSWGLRGCQSGLDSKSSINMLFSGLDVFSYQTDVPGHAVDVLFLYDTFSPSSASVWVEHSGQHQPMSPSLPHKHPKSRTRCRQYWCCCCWYPPLALKKEVLAIVTKRLSSIYAKPNKFPSNKRQELQ